MKLEELPTAEDWDEYDWQEVLAGGSGYGPVASAELAGKNGPAEVPSAENVTEVIWFFADSPERYGSKDFAALVKLADGQFAMCEAWADTTGWDCRSDAIWKIGPTLDSVKAELSDVNRDKVS